MEARSATTWFVALVMSLLSLTVNAQTDSCYNAPVLAVGSSCTPVGYSIPAAFVISPVMTACVPMGNIKEDGWFKFTATAASTVITATTDRNVALAVYSGSCTSLTELACINNGGTGITETLTLPTIMGTLYYLRVIRFLSGSGGMAGTICVHDAPVAASCPVSLGSGRVVVSSLPFSSSSRTTCGKGNNLTASNAVIAGNTAYYAGEDEVFEFTSPATGNITVSLTSAQSNINLTVYRNCPFTGQGGVVEAYSQTWLPNPAVCFQATAGSTYYVLADVYGASCISGYSISISYPVSGLSGSTCSNPVVISSLPFSLSGQTTLCKGNNYNNGVTGSCQSVFESGEDMVFRYDAASAGCITVSLKNTSHVYAGFMVYSGCPGTAGAQCLGFTGGGNVSGTYSLPAPGSYYIMVDTWASPTHTNFDLEIVSNGSGPVNDLPCHATVLPLGVMMAGDNGCATSHSEPAIPSCWTAGAMHTVWYKITAPPSGKVHIKTQAGTLSETQIAVYSGSCSALNQSMPLAGSCNRNAPSCGLTVNKFSELNMSGLVAGSDYYIRVDGANDLTGSFRIIAIDGNGNTAMPPAYGQDCSLPLPVCTSTITTGNPGYQSFGNNCDFTGGGANCLLAGERGSAWFLFKTHAPGSLMFDILPNDWNGAPFTASTDYDFALWKINGVANWCSQLNTLVPLRCNYDPLGVTGLFTSGNAPAAFPGFDAAYEPPVSVSANDSFLLVISNFSTSQSGFTLKFNSASPVSYNSSPAFVSWTGSLSSDWFNPENWGGCAIPSCGIDAVISGPFLNQPVINANGAACKNLIISNGSRLTVNPAYSLSVCGNFVNQSQFQAAAGSSVVFNGALNSLMDGNLTGTNSIHHLVVNKPSGAVTLDKKLEVRGDFQIVNPVSVFNAQQNELEVKGNFYSMGSFNQNGNGWLTFSGSTLQQYLHAGILNHVRINNTGSGIQLGSSVNINGVLMLQSGIIHTGTHEVSLLNRNNNAVNTGNASAFVNGKLRRYLNATGDYHFPVGNLISGYQNARITFTSPTLTDQLLVQFHNYPVLPGPVNQNECGAFFNQPPLNNGYWTFVPSDNPHSGIYDLTLYNRAGSFTNDASGSYSVMQHDGSNWNFVSGNCQPSVPTSVVRTGIAGYYPSGTAQGLTPLPVQWLTIYAETVKSFIRLKWSTASELNNAGFEIERAEPDKTFAKIGFVTGNGTTSQVSSYHFTDENAEAGYRYYYRLRQIDFNGAFTYSPVVTAMLNKSQQTAVYVFPNPSSGQVWLTVRLPEKEKITIELFDMIGRKRATLYDGLPGSDSHLIEINRSTLNLSSGIYQIRITGKDGIQNLKLQLL